MAILKKARRFLCILLFTALFIDVSIDDFSYLTVSTFKIQSNTNKIAVSFCKPNEKASRELETFFHNQVTKVRFKYKSYHCFLMKETSKSVSETSISHVLELTSGLQFIQSTATQWLLKFSPVELSNDTSRLYYQTDVSDESVHDGFDCNDYGKQDIQWKARECCVIDCLFKQGYSIPDYYSNPYEYQNILTKQFQNESLFSIVFGMSVAELQQARRLWNRCLELIEEGTLSARQRSIWQF